MTNYHIEIVNLELYLLLRTRRFQLVYSPNNLVHAGKKHWNELGAAPSLHFSVFLRAHTTLRGAHPPVMTSHSGDRSYAGMA